MSSPDVATFVMNYSDLMRSDQPNTSFDELDTPVYSSNNSQKAYTYCLFLGDISLFCSEEDLTRAFSVFGELADVRIKRNKITKRNLSYGFVEYKKFNSADAAIRAMDGKVLCGRALKVRWSESKEEGCDDEKKSSETNSNSEKSVSVYIAFNSTVPNLMINDESLRVLFAPFGRLEDVSIKQSIMDRQTRHQRGYSFVCFESNERGMQAALNAVTHLADCHIDGVHYRCELSNSLRTKLSTNSGSPHPTSMASSVHSDATKSVCMMPTPVLQMAPTPTPCHLLNNPPTQQTHQAIPMAAVPPMSMGYTMPMIAPPPQQQFHQNQTAFQSGLYQQQQSVGVSAVTSPTNAFNVFPVRSQTSDMSHHYPQNTNHHTNTNSNANFQATQQFQQQPSYHVYDQPAPVNHPGMMYYPASSTAQNYHNGNQNTAASMMSAPVPFPMAMSMPMPTMAAYPGSMIPVSMMPTPAPHMMMLMPPAQVNNSNYGNNFASTHFYNQANNMNYSNNIDNNNQQQQASYHTQPYSNHGYNSNATYH